MKTIKYLLANSLAALFGVAIVQSGDCAELQAVERTAVSPPADQIIHPAVAGMHIKAVPVLLPGKPAWISIVDSHDRPISGVTVLVNARAQDADPQGHVSIAVPNAGAVSFALQDAEKHDVERLDYALVPGGLLVIADAAPAISNILKGLPETGRGPKLIYSPAVVEPAHSFTVLGTRFDTTPETLHLVVNGAQITPLSVSPMAVLASLPAHAPLGPIQEIYVSQKEDEASNVLEVDVARTEFSYDKDALGPGKEIDASVSMVGSNLPALVKVTNSDSKATELSVVGGKRLGADAVLLLPGGDHNALPMRLLTKQSGTPEISTGVFPEAPELLSGALSNAVMPDPFYMRAIYQAELVKLKRRLVAVEDRVAEDKKSRDAIPPAQTTGPEWEKINTGLKSLAIRQDALSMALRTRKALLESAGGSEADYQKAIDDATGGAYYVIELATRDVELVSTNPVAGKLASVAPSTITNVVTPRRRRDPLAEPRMKLLPPLELSSADIEQAQAPVPGHSVVDTKSSLSQEAASVNVKAENSSPPKTPISNGVVAPKTSEKQTGVKTAGVGKTAQAKGSTAFTAKKLKKEETAEKSGRRKHRDLKNSRGASAKTEASSSSSHRRRHRRRG